MAAEKVSGGLLALVEREGEPVADVQAQRFEHRLVVIAIEELDRNGGMSELTRGSEAMDAVNDAHRVSLDEHRRPHVDRLSERSDMLRIEATRPRPITDVDI